MNSLVILFIVLRFVQQTFETWLGLINRTYYENVAHQEEAIRVLGITAENMQQSLAYSRDKFRFSLIAGWTTFLITMVFVGVGGIGWFESLAKQYFVHPIAVGLAFFALLGLASGLLSLPVRLYHTFVIEQRHGFNRQTPAGFAKDLVKGIVLGAILGGTILSALLWIMGAMGATWWLWAWVAITAFSMFTAWAYPTFISPLFNKFSPLAEGELKTLIESLALKIGFKTAGISIMNASIRSSHGNAYFTGIMGAKKIVLFDTLIDTLTPKEVVAVLAHELGHFKLRHVRWGLIRGIATTGLMFFLVSLCLPMDVFYTAFGLEAVTNYGALVVFTMWFGLADFMIQPIGNYISRRNEFAADDFARATSSAEDLAAALLKLREKSHQMPLTHPLFSWMHYSHPPMLERIRALRAQ